MHILTLIKCFFPDIVELMSIYPIKKAIFPIAGLGTRFLPATKATPKEMLPIVDKPLIQYAVEEAVKAGITDLIFVTNISKRAIEDHFDINYELEAKLQSLNKPELLAMVQDIIPRGVSCIYIRQPVQLGLGHAVLCAKNIVGNDFFVVLLADELIQGNGSSCLQQMLGIYQQTSSSVIAVQSVEPSEVNRYGIVGLAGNNRVTAMVEKPEASAAPSNFAAIGRYILSPQIFNILESVEMGAGNEIQLTDAISGLLLQEEVYAHCVQGQRYDCGSKLGYIKATIDFALAHPEIGDQVREYLQMTENKGTHRE